VNALYLASEVVNYAEGVRCRFIDDVLRPLEHPMLRAAAEWDRQVKLRSDMSNSPKFSPRHLVAKFYVSRVKQVVVIDT
jgi:hypothetical protein